METTNMSPADFSALMGNNGMNGNGAWWLILLFLFIGNGWNRNGDYGQYATAASQQDILFSSKFQALDNKIDRLGNGIADATFSLNNTIHNTQDILGGAIGNEGRALQAQLSESTCKIENAVHAEGEATRALIQQNLVQSLRDRVSALEADSRMCGVVRYPQQMVYATNASPFCNYPANGCGCGNI